MLSLQSAITVQFLKDMGWKHTAYQSSNCTISGKYILPVHPKSCREGEKEKEKEKE